MTEHEISISTPICTIDPYEHLQIAKNPDGTITRRFEFPTTPPSTDLSTPYAAVTKDVPLNPQKNTWIRLFLPKSSLTVSTKLPIIIYFHGGGFVIIHADSNICHDQCARLAAEAAALLVSVDYRLAPEHRLPAAYDDSIEALDWIKGKGGQEDAWVKKYGDISRCILMGSSAGGNIAYHVGLRASSLFNELEPLKIKGMILHQPYFGGVKRTGSELRLLNDPVLPISCSDLMWELALPVGADRNHEYCNPIVGGGSSLERVKDLGWRVLVTGCGGDPLIDRILECVGLLEEKGVTVMTHLSEDGCHGVELTDPAKAEELYLAIKRYLESCF